MTADELARFRSVVDLLDEAVAQRPDILGSPAGFVAAALIGAANTDPEGTWLQVAGFADYLVYLVVFVREGRGSADELVAALIPRPSVTAAAALDGS